MVGAGRTPEMSSQLLSTTRRNIPGDRHRHTRPPSQHEISTTGKINVQVKTVAVRRYNLRYNVFLPYTTQRLHIEVAMK